MAPCHDESMPVAIFQRRTRRLEIHDLMVIPAHGQNHPPAQADAWFATRLDEEASLDPYA